MAKNAIFNPDFDFWQRGTTFNATGYTSDRWYLLQQLTSNPLTVFQDTDAAPNSQFSLSLSNTAIYTLGNTDVAAIQYYIEGYHIKWFAHQTNYLSFHYKTNFSGPYYIALNNGDWTQTYLIQWNPSASGTWQTQKFTISSSPTGGTWNFQNGPGLVITFLLAAGSNYLSNIGTTTWTTTTPTIYGQTNQVNFLSSTSNYMKFNQVQFEIFSQDVIFNSRAYPTELVNCQRYYTKMGDGILNQPFGVGYNSTTLANTAYIYIPYPTTMRQPPAISYSSLSDFKLLNSSGGTAISTISITPQGTDSTKISVTVPSSTVLASSAGNILIGATTAAKLTFDAEIPIRRNLLGSASSNTSSLTINLTTTKNANPGDLILVAIAYNASTTGVTITNCAINGSNMTSAITQSYDTNSRIYIFYYQVTQVISALAVSATLTGTATSSTIIAYQVLATAQQTLDKDASNSATSTTPASNATATTTQALEYVFGAIATKGPNNDSVGTWNNNFIADTNIGSGTTLTDTFLRTGYYVSLVTGTFNASMSGITSRPWGAAVATFY